MPPTPTMTPDARKLLSRQISDLRAWLLTEALPDAMERRYRLATKPEHAGLSAAAARDRARLETWLAEQVRARPDPGEDPAAARARLLEESRTRAAATLVNRVVLLRCMEATGVRKEAVVTGGNRARAFRDLVEFVPALASDALCAAVDDPSLGYALALELVFEELEPDLPGLLPHGAPSTGRGSGTRSPPSSRRTACRRSALRAG